MASSDERIVQEVRRLAAQAAADLGIELVEVVFRRSGRYSMVRVDLDHPGAPGVTLDECKRLSEALSPRLDETGLLDFQYHLEVSSPGLDRPIRTEDDVRRNRGRRVQVETSAPIQGSQSLRGLLLGLEDEALRLRLDAGDEVLIPREQVVLAHQEIDLRGGEARPAGPRRGRGQRAIVKDRKDL